MGKHRLKFKTMKFRQNGTLIPDQDSDSDVQEFALPKKRIVKPGKSPYVTRKRAGCCRTCASIVLSLILIASILCVVVLGWFSLRLKRDLDLLKIRLAEVETSDRSTSKECLEQEKRLDKKLELLRGSSASHLETDEKKFHLLFKRIEVLNSTVKYLRSKLKSPKSVSSIHNDISLLKKAMADTSTEMTEVTDKVKQLRKIAHLQNNNIKHLKIQMYNVSVQIAKLSGQPTPRPQFNTATQPWLLRVPAADRSSSHTKATLHAKEAEKLRINITTQVRKDMIKLVSFVKRANKTVQSQVQELNVRLLGLGKNISKHMALIDSLMKAHRSSDSTDGEQTGGASITQGVLNQYKNLTKMVRNLRNMFNKHHQQFQEITSDIASINHTVHQRVGPSSTSCNCSLETIWTALSKDKQVIHSLKTDLGLLQESVQKLIQQDEEPTTALMQTPENETVKTSARNSPTKIATATTSQQPTMAKKNVSGSISTTSKPVASTNATLAPTTVQPEQAANETKRMTDDDDDEQTDLDSWKDDGADQLPQDDGLFSDNKDK